MPAQPLSATRKGRWTAAAGMNVTSPAAAAGTTNTPPTQPPSNPATATKLTPRRPLYEKRTRPRPPSSLRASPSNNNGNASNSKAGGVRNGKLGREKLKQTEGPTPSSKKKKGGVGRQRRISPAIRKNTAAAAHALCPKDAPREESLPSLSQEEARHLRRAFDFIAGLAKRTKLNAKLDKALDHSLKLQEYIRIGDTLDPEVASLTPPQAEAELKVLGAKISQVRGEIGALHEDSHKKISRHDLDAALQRLGKTFPPKQLEYIIWEVDENLDGYVDWDEFQRTFLRNMVDETGTEPRELFNIVQFLTLDENQKGQITEDETISTLFTRYGAQRIEGIMANLFGEKLKNRGGQGTLTFIEYLDRVGVRMQPTAKYGSMLPFASVERL